MRRSFIRSMALMALSLISLASPAPARAESGPGTGSVAGTIRDTAGKAIPGASVRLSKGDRARTVQSREDGTYLFEKVPTGTGYGLRVQAPRHRVAEQGPLTVAEGETTRVDFALVPERVPDTGAIVGSVRGAGGRAIVGARIEILSGPSDGRATSGREGRFELRGLRPGVYALTFSTAGHATRIREGLEVRAGRVVEIRVELDSLGEDPVGAIFGVVKNGEGQPVSGATVRITAGPTIAEIGTDAEGRYTLAPLVPGLYSLRVTADGYRAAEAGGIRVEAGQERRVDFTVRRGEEPRFGTVSGTVTDADRRPIAGATVTVIAGPTIRSSVTDGEGRYRLEELLPGNYALRASKDGYLPQTRETPVVAGQNRSVSFLLRTEGSQFGRIVGRVTNGSGAAVPGATVAIQEGRSTLTNEEGRYELNELEPGGHTLTASKAGFRSSTAAATVIAGRVTERNFVLRAEEPTRGRIFGRIRNPQGAGIAEARATIIAGPVLKSAFANGEGDYALEELTAGSYRIRFSREGYRSVDTEVIVLTAGQARELNVTLQPVEQPSLGRITGRVRNSGEDALAEVKVEILAGPVTGRTVFTNVSGEYLLGELPAGTYRLKFSKSGYNPLEVGEVVVTAGGATTRNATLTR